MLQILANEKSKKEKTKNERKKRHTDRKGRYITFFFFFEQNSQNLKKSIEIPLGTNK